GRRDADPHLAVRRLQLRHPAQGQAGVLGAVPPGGLAGPARLALFVQALRRSDAGEQAGVSACNSRRRAATAEARITDARGRRLAHATTTCLVFEIPEGT